MNSLFIFRRDFRLNDNTAFIECYKKSETIIPIFIFTPEQVVENDYFSNNAFQFMIESLNELNDYLKNEFNSKLYFFYGKNIDVLKSLFDKNVYNSIFFNMDYTPYARKRDSEIVDFCKENSIESFIFEDYLLAPIGTFLKKDGTCYEKYTPFKNNSISKNAVKKINNYKFTGKKLINNEKLLSKNKFNIELNDINKYYTKNENLLIHGGRERALDILKTIKNGEFINYDNERNDLKKETTHLSAYIKFGCVSIREVYDCVLKSFGIKHGIIAQLYWREFYYYLGYYIPKVMEGHSLKEKYDSIKWTNNKKSIEAWKKGETGFPSVDAGMRQMNETGFMHNRARLITSGTLIKILQCDWRIGEKYFAQNLVDYDPMVNNGNWQWSSGSGADSQPYFRILSPWKQAIDNDGDCVYIKKWIPELRDLSKKDILKWNEYKGEKIEYVKPIVDYEKMRKEIVEIYKKGFEEYDK
jgi:deoxyribodipyrimidine photo-lyase